MSGQPKRRQVVERLEELGGVEWLCEQIADGRSLLDIATVDVDCSRWLLQRWIHADPDREARYQEAKREGAAAMVEDGKTLLDTANEQSTAAVQKARFRADYRKWYAGVLMARASAHPTAARRSTSTSRSCTWGRPPGPRRPGWKKLPEAATDVPRLEPGDTFEDPHEEDGQ